MHPDEDYAYETQRQRKLDNSWVQAEGGEGAVFPTGQRTEGVGNEMISALNTACTATFMMAGMLAEEVKHRTFGPDRVSTRDLYTVWDKGAIALHFELCRYAELSEKIANFIQGEGEYDFPGVYDYEVSEPFGVWFAAQLFANGDAPAFVDAKTRLLRESAKFFTQGEDERDFEAGALYNKLRTNL